MTCPSCGKAMFLIRLSDYVRWQCPGCGVRVDPHELIEDEEDDYEDNCDDLPGCDPPGRDVCVN
jgi:hypothetical protein